MIGSPCRRSRDDGFTIVESVIAAGILFFVLTALFSLSHTSSQMAGSSRGRTILTNAVSAKLDIYRTYDWQAGELQPGFTSTETTLVSGWSVVLVSRVTSSTAPSNASTRTREVTIEGSASHAGFSSVSYSATAAVRDPQSPLTRLGTDRPMSLSSAVRPRTRIRRVVVVRG